MINTILVPATGEESDRAVLAAAFGIAREFAAHVEALHIRMDAVDTAVGLTSDGPGGGILIERLIEQLERDARLREAQAKRLFDEFCARENLALVEAPPQQTESRPTAGWRAETGDEVRLMRMHGMAADLIVAGRGTEHDENARAVLEAALLETGRPLLIPSAAASAPLFGGTVAIAWKPTPQAARAVAAAIPFIKRAENAVVLTVEDGNTYEDAENLVRYLAWHGCSASVKILRPDRRKPVETLLAAAKEKARLLVMGGYGHNRLREWVFGGFTQRVLADAPLPVLMAH